LKTFDYLVKNTDMKNLLLLLLFVFLFSACRDGESSEERQSGLGDIQHSFSISDEAQQYFDKGLLLLHSFEYDDAREEFEKARQADPDEIMVYWGLAMTHYKALWGLQDLEAGRKIMIQLDEQGVDAESPLEEKFWQGVEILYGDGEVQERNQQYADHMAELYEEYPDNLEVAAFYSLGLMWADYDNQDYLDRSARIAEGIIKENPTHPGALHYMIHANDNPKYASAAINAADQYADVAPDATHALHMPSHIYVALGMWNEVVSSNEASYRASLNRMNRKGLSGKERGYHSMAWLHYGYLQQGRYDKAADLLAEMISYRSDSTYSPDYLIMMQNQQRIESGEWPDHIEPQDVPYESLGLREMSAMHFFKSMLAFDDEDPEAIQIEIEKLNDHLEVERLLVTNNGIALCSTGPTRYAPTEESVEKTEVVLHQMQALLALVKQDELTAEEHLRQATALEEASHYDPGPRFMAYPSC
jgi:tetratricopeptide (TPR) repeat protein